MKSILGIHEWDVKVYGVEARQVDKKSCKHLKLLNISSPDQSSN